MVLEAKTLMLYTLLVSVGSKPGTLVELPTDEEDEELEDMVYDEIELDDREDRSTVRTAKIPNLFHLNLTKVLL